MKKSELRQQASLQRKSLDRSAVKELSLGLLETFKQLNFSGIQSLHTFLPIHEKNEPDTFLFIDWLREMHPHIKIIVPKTDFSSLQMTHHVLTDHKDLQKNMFNILEPAASVLHTGDIDLVLVPLLAFDLMGYRVGYGKGFYDRFLRDFKTIKLGISLFAPVSAIDDADAWDVPLDACLTPERRYDFTAKGLGI